jgi:putative endonuclease
MKLKNFFNFNHSPKPYISLKTQQQEIGDSGEQIAADYITNLGYKILHRNWHFGHDELDIVARDGDELVIVEVKSRTGEEFEHPSEALSNKKIKHIVEAAEAYIQTYDVEEDTRFDLITIIFLGENYILEHFKEAFYPGI